MGGGNIVSVQRAVDVDRRCVELARELVPMARQHAAFAEEHGRLHDDVVSAFQSSGLYSVNVPDQYGGTSPSPRAQCEAIIELSRGDASAGWCFMVSSGFNWQAGRDFPDAVLEKAFGDVTRHITGSFMPAFFAQPVDGGFTVSGESRFNSNVYRSGYKFVLAIVNDGRSVKLEDGEIPTLRAMLVPGEHCEVVSNWDVLGLRGTGSNNVKLSNVFVPEGNAVDIVHEVNKRPHEIASPIYRLPYIPWTGFHTAAVLIGIAEEAVEAFVRHTTSKIMLTNKLQSQSAFPATRSSIADVATRVRGAKAHLLFTADECWAICNEGREFTSSEQAHMQMAAYETSRVSADAVIEIFRVCGGTAIYKTMPLEKMLRDVLTANQHLSVSTHRSHAAISRRLLGLSLEKNQPFD